MSAQRGIAAFKKQAEAAGERRMTGFASILLMKSGDSQLVRFRGLFVEPTHKLTSEQIKELSPDWLSYYAAVLGIAEQQKLEDWVRAILLRYKQVEPFIYTQHYIHGNKGRDSYLTCSKEWNPATDCPSCYAKDSGDARISRRTQHVVSVQPYRWYHKLEGRGQPKATYADCPAIRGENCRYCSAGHQAKQEGVRYLSLAEMHMEGISACVDRVGQRCAICGIGKIINQGWQCSVPTCGEPLPNYHAPLPPLPDNYDPKTFCPECKTKMRPDEVLKCSKGCEQPRRCQMHDVDVLVQRMGEKKTTTYQFTEQWPAEPMTQEFMAGFNVPNYETAMKPREQNEHCRIIGLVNNPFTGAVIGAAPGAGTESYDDAAGADGSVYGEEAADGVEPGTGEEGTGVDWG